MKKIIKVCIWGSVSKDANQFYLTEAERLARLSKRYNDLSEHYSLEFINGGGEFGFLGSFNDAALDVGLDVTGYSIPEFFELEKHARMNRDGKLIVVPTIQERERMMVNGVDHIIMAPGGWGTMEELMTEVIGHEIAGTFRGEGDKPVVPIHILNAGGYYSWFNTFLKEMEMGGMVRFNAAELVDITHSAYHCLSHIVPDKEVLLKII